MAESPKELIESSLGGIANCVSCDERPSPDSHTVVEVAGLDDPSVPRYLACYAVAFLAGWVQRDATIAERLGIQGVEKRTEVLRLVDRVVTADSDTSPEDLTTWKQTWRNPWIAEVLTHALFVIHRTSVSGFLTGGVLALLRPHPLPKRQGLDSIAIYGEEGIAVMAIGETKATVNNASAQLTNACEIFDSVDLGLYGPDLRDAIDILGDLLPPHLQSQVTEALWRKNRCYLPTIFHEATFDPSSRRDRLAKLEPIAARKRVLVCRILDFEAFFDAMATAMPSVIEELIV
jgi:hypothetical protein